MNIFETVKAAVPVRQAAEHYGLKVSRNGMACCPFHNDRHPSLKLNEEYFFRFGCGAKGDVIDFAAQMFDLSSYEAAQRLAADFGISTQPGQAVVVPHKPKRPHIRQFREDEMFCFRVLTDYLASAGRLESTVCDTAGHPGTGTGRLHPAFQRTGRERAAARCRLCDLRVAAARSCIGFTYIGKSNVGESHAGKPYVGKSNAIK